MEFQQKIAASFKIAQKRLLATSHSFGNQLDQEMLKLREITTFFNGDNQVDFVAVCFGGVCV